MSPYEHQTASSSTVQRSLGHQFDYFLLRPKAGRPELANRSKYHRCRVCQLSLIERYIISTQKRNRGTHKPTGNLLAWNQEIVGKGYTFPEPNILKHVSGNGGYKAMGDYVIKAKEWKIYAWEFCCLSLQTTPFS